MTDTIARRSIVSSGLARFLNSLRKVNSESLETELDKENYQFLVADSLNSTFEQIKCNVELDKRNLSTSIKNDLMRRTNEMLLRSDDHYLNDHQDVHLKSGRGNTRSEFIPIRSREKNDHSYNRTDITTCGHLPVDRSTELYNSQSSSLNKTDQPTHVCNSVQSSSYTSNQTLDSLNSSNISNSSDCLNTTLVQQSMDSGLSTLQLSDASLAHHQHNKLAVHKKDEQAFISNLLYFLNLKNESQSANTSSAMTINDDGLKSRDFHHNNNLPEHIALSLVKIFSKLEPSFKIDPNELDCWLISEDEVPQKLLPIPNNVKFLTHHLNQTNSFISEQSENDVESIKSQQHKNCSESNPIDIQTLSFDEDASTSTANHLSKKESLDLRLIHTGEDQQTKDDKINNKELETNTATKLLGSSAAFLTNNLMKPIAHSDEQEEMQKLNTLFNSGKFLNFPSLRGNNEWARPREMIHVTIHPSPKRHELIAKQNQRCCGCGLFIEKQDIPRMLYCYYTGKYFCKYGCHSQIKTIIPAYVINKWSFKLYPVSNFAFQVIQNIYTKPLFDTQDLNPKLFNKVKKFQNLQDLRCQLLKLRDYIITCKKAGNLLVVYLTFEPKHFVTSSKDLNHLTYSLEDLVDIKRDCKTLERCFELVQESIKHIRNCTNCLAKGFICELCSINSSTNINCNRSSSSTSNNRNSMDILFPYENGRVHQCDVCYACYHLNCFANNGSRCVKCLRIEQRKSSLLLETIVDTNVVS